MCVRLASGEVPDLCAFVLTCGFMIGLNKIPEADQQKQRKRGPPPKLRPVNVGCYMLKWSLKLSTPGLCTKAATTDGYRSTPRVERVIHLTRTLREKKCAIITPEEENGFSFFKSQAMLEAVNKRAPGLTKFFNKYYARKSPCLVVMDDVVEHLINLITSVALITLITFDDC